MTDEKFALMIAWAFKVLGAVLVIVLLFSLYQGYLDIKIKHEVAKRLKQNGSLQDDFYALKMLKEVESD